MIAEKLIENKLNDDILTRIYKLKNVNIDIDLLLDTIEDVVGDDYDALYDAGISFDSTGTWFGIDVDKIIDKFNDYIEDGQYIGNDEENIKQCLNELKDLNGYIIYNIKETIESYKEFIEKNE